MSEIEDEVCRKIQQRAEFWLQKYGVTLERTDLSYKDWLVHIQEELMDACSYLEVVIQKEAERGTLLQEVVKHLQGTFIPPNSIPDEGAQTLALYQDGSICIAEYDHAQNWWKSNPVSTKISMDVYGCTTMMVSPIGWRYL